MPTINSILYHGYLYGTAFWYASRGLCRVYDPKMVAGWFRPPFEAHLGNTDLELYNVRTDGWCLITLALVLISLSNAVPVSPSSTSTPASRAVARETQPGTTGAIVKAVITSTVFHHIVTGIGAWQHYKLDTHYNTSMFIGVWGNVWLTLVGVLTVASLQSGEGERDVHDVTKKTH